MTSPASPERAAREPARDLAVAFAFPPFADTAAVVAAKRVLQAGRPVDLISNDMSGKRDTDPQLDRIADHLVRRRATLATSTLFSSWKGVAQFTEEGLPLALDWDTDGPGYERLYSRAHWVPSHVLAARFKAERPHVRWTAEFSDPLSLYVDSRERSSPVEEGALLDRLREDLRQTGFTPPADNLFQWVETLAYALADELLFTNRQQRDLMLSRISDGALAERARERAIVKGHPTLPSQFYEMAEPEPDLDPGRRHIGYFGNFYAIRGMSSVLTALENLPDGVRGRLHLHVYTGQQDDVRAEVAARGLQETVRLQPFVGYLDFLALSTRMDVLLVNDAVTKGVFPVNPFLPSKWSDYRGSGRPVWGVVEPNSPLAEQPLDYRSPVQHVTAALQVLHQIARR